MGGAAKTRNINTNFFGKTLTSFQYPRFHKQKKGTDILATHTKAKGIRREREWWKFLDRKKKKKRKNEEAAAVTQIIRSNWKRDSANKQIIK